MSWLPKKTIIVPVDFSDESIAAVDVALELGDGSSAVHVIHVLPDYSNTEFDVRLAEIKNENRSQHAAEALRERFNLVACGRSGDDKYHDLQIQIDFGDPGYRIADFAKQRNADLIVMPSHGRTGLKRLLIGSVAERVLRLAPCPVLILRN